MDDDRSDELTKRVLRVLNGQNKKRPVKLGPEESAATKVLNTTSRTGAPKKVAVTGELSHRMSTVTQIDRPKHEKTHKKLINRRLGEDINELRVKGFNWRVILTLLRENNPELRNVEQIQTIYFDYLDISRQNRRENIAEMREIQHERLEAAWNGLAPKIEAGRERAVEVGVKVLERQARLWGLDASDAIENKQSNQQINILIQAHPQDARAKELIIEHQPQQQLLEEHKD